MNNLLNLIHKHDIELKREYTKEYNDIKQEIIEYKDNLNSVNKQYITFDVNDYVKTNKELHLESIDYVKKIDRIQNSLKIKAIRRARFIYPNGNEIMSLINGEEYIKLRNNIKLLEIKYNSHKSLHDTRIHDKIQELKMKLDEYGYHKEV